MFLFFSPLFHAVAMATKVKGQTPVRPETTAEGLNSPDNPTDVLRGHFGGDVHRCYTMQHGGI